jgi:hypothetical protein
MGHFPDQPELMRVICPEMPGYRSNIPFAGTSAWVSSTLNPNEAYYVPIFLPRSYNLKAMWMLNGAGVAQNIDIGIYSVDGVRLWSLGTTAQGAANTLVIYTLATPILLPPGTYYLAIVGSSGSGTFFHRAAFGRAGMLRLSGVMNQATALPLPATATWSAFIRAKLPVFGIASITSF